MQEAIRTLAMRPLPSQVRMQEAMPSLAIQLSIADGLAGNLLAPDRVSLSHLTNALR